MTNITVHRYQAPSRAERADWPAGTMAVSDSWQGYIEPEDRSWIVFVDVNGVPVMFLNRDPQTGAVIQ